VPFRVLLLAAALALNLAAAETRDAAEIRQTAGVVTKDLGVQTRLPNSTGTEAAERRDDNGFETGGGGISIPAPTAVLNLVQWVVVAAVAILLLGFLVTALRERSDSAIVPRSSGPGPEPEVPVLPTSVPALLARADELAAAGKYAEAMHCVLLAAMSMVGGDQASRNKDSLTSWELLRASALAPLQLQALRDLVMRVERAWFGKQPAAVEDYRYVRGRFDEFAAATMGAIA
jgi:hypothetical protein